MYIDAYLKDGYGARSIRQPLVDLCSHFQAITYDGLCANKGPDGMIANGGLRVEQPIRPRQWSEPKIAPKSSLNCREDLDNAY